MIPNEAYQHFMKLAKKHRDKVREYSNVLHITENYMEYTNGFFLVQYSSDCSQLPQGTVSVETHLIKEYDYPNTGRFFDIPMISFDNIKQAIEIAQEIKPEKKSNISINLLSGDLTKDPKQGHWVRLELLKDVLAFLDNIVDYEKSAATEKKDMIFLDNGSGIKAVFMTAEISD
jgi:hypothetical protein